MYLSNFVFINLFFNKNHIIIIEPHGLNYKSQQQLNLLSKCMEQTSWTKRESGWIHHMDDPYPLIPI